LKENSVSPTDFPTTFYHNRKKAGQSDSEILTKFEFVIIIQLFCKPTRFVAADRFLRWFFRLAASSLNYPEQLSLRIFCMNIYVGNLPYSATEEQLRNMFGQYGEVVSASIIKDRDTGRSKGFGFVEMSDDAAAEEAIQALNEADMNGRNLKINQARPKEARSDRPRGGDRGGYRGGYGDKGDRGYGDKGDRGYGDKGDRGYNDRGDRGGYRGGRGDRY